MSIGNIIAIVAFIYTAITGVIGFFLKRSYNQLDTKASKAEIETKASQEEVEANKKEICKLRDSVDGIKTNYLTKDDFYREQAKTDQKLDRIMEILLEMHGGKRG